MDRRHALVVRATMDAEFCEISALGEALKYHAIEVDEIDVTSSGHLAGLQLASEVARIDREWDYIYVCAHGDSHGFGDEHGDTWIPWHELSAAICTSLRPGTIFLVACCRGGFNEVAYWTFAGCDNVDAVIGPRFNATSGDLRTGFMAFLHHCEARQNDPTVAANAASVASGIEFKLYDRLETTSGSAYARWSDATFVASVPAVAT